MPVLIRRNPEYGTFSLGVVENPDTSPLPRYNRLSWYKTLIGAGVDIIAPCFVSSGINNSAYAHVYDIALAGAQSYNFV